MRLSGLMPPLILSLGALACTGPRPDAGEPRLLDPASRGAPYRVAFALKNEGSGEGQVDLDVRLHEKRTGEIYSADKKVNLKGDETLQVIVDVPAPPGEYTIEVAADYPPG